ncbi:MAG: nucleotide exchange factor GrpE [Patescibacteria group bacterium]
MSESNSQPNCEEYLNGWKRAKADLINYQKDEVKRFEEVVKFSNSSIVRDIINVLDSFDLAIAALEKQGPVEKGIYMIRTQLEDALKKHGLERLIISIGQAFDTNLHESVGEIESKNPAGAIAEEVARGYLLNGRIIRPARVKLSK